MTSRRERGVDELLEEMLVDAYDDTEQLCSLELGISENIELPFAATVLGHPVQVRDVEFDGNERRGLIAHTDRGPVSLLDVVPKTPEVMEYVNAYRSWAGVELLRRVDNG